MRNASLESACAAASPTSADARASSTRPRSASISALTRPTHQPRRRSRPASSAALAWSSASCQRPASHSSSAQVPQHMRSRDVVPSCRRPRLQLLEHDARAFDLTEAHQESSEVGARTRRVLEREPEAPLDLRTPLEQAGSDLGGPCLGVPGVGDRCGDQRRIARPLGLLECRTSVGEVRLDVGLVEVEKAPAEPGSGQIGCRRRRRSSVPLRRARSRVGIVASPDGGEPVRGRPPARRRAEPRRGAARARRLRAPARRRGGESSRPASVVSGRGSDRTGVSSAARS